MKKSTNRITASGKRIVALATETRGWGPDFPGWGDPNAADFLVAITAGMTGEIVCTESHGSNPWTRYSVKFDNGTRASGLVLGKDFKLAQDLKVELIGLLIERDAI